MALILPQPWPLQLTFQPPLSQGLDARGCGPSLCDHAKGPEPLFPPRDCPGPRINLGREYSVPRWPGKNYPEWSYWPIGIHWRTGVSTRQFLQIGSTGFSGKKGECLTAVGVTLRLNAEVESGNPYQIAEIVACANRMPTLLKSGKEYCRKSEK